MANSNFSFVSGDLVVSLYGNGDGSGPYTDNQATPIVLQQLSTSGQAAGSFVLPQTASTSGGVTENPISGEYGSSSEGTLQLSGDGQSLAIAGYGVNAATYNSGGAAVYGDARLAQSTSVPNNSNGYTPVTRVIADIRYDNVVDTSTAVYNIDNTNNPRSVATVDGSSFYLAGQGKKGDTTQGLFYIQKGASSGTAINSTSDNRITEIYNGNLYVSTDSKQGPASNISVYSGLPTSQANPTILSGLNKSVTLGTGQGNEINSSSGTVNLSPEAYFFANPTTLYVADSGLPKQGGVGDGGLQKWNMTNGTWSLSYTISSGLNLQDSTTASSGTTGLIGLTGKVVGDQVSLYSTNSTIGDLDRTALYSVTDKLSATTKPAGENFTQIYQASDGVNIRGVAFAPEASAVTCFTTATRIRTERGELAVDDLSVGDRVVTASGLLRRIIWIGHREISAAGHVLNHDEQPVRIRAGAFGASLPARDLFLSPGHPVLVAADTDCEGGVLVPIMCLINGTTIIREARAHVTYWHIELDQHDILLAEGLPAESYLDWGDRAFFSEASDHALQNPDFVVPGLSGRCRPVVVEGPVVEAERARLDRVFALDLIAHCAWEYMDHPV